MAAKRFSIEAVFKAVDRVTRPVTRMQNNLRKFSRGIGRSLTNAERSFSRFNAKVMRTTKNMARLAAVGITSVSVAVGSLVKQFSKLEDAQAAFTPLLGNAERAAELVERINQTAATTPFQFRNLANQANQLLPVMNGNIEKTIETMRMLGDTAGGNAQKLESITRGFTKAALKGKVDLESLNMIAEAGVPIFDQMARQLGVSTGELFKLISAGRISTSVLEDSFRSMTKEGGIFFKGMEISSRTTSGVLSTMRDNIALAAAEIGKVLAPTVKDLAIRVTEAAKNVKKWARENRELINEKFTAFLKTVKMIGQAVVKVFSFLVKHKEKVFAFLVVIGLLIAALKILAVVLGVINVLMWANPVGLIIAGIILLIAVISALIIWVDELIAGFKKLPMVIQVLMWPLRNMLNQLKVIKDSFAFIFDKAGELFGLSMDDEASQGGSTSQMVTPQERTARTIEETRETSSAEILLRSEQGTIAEVISGSLGDGLKLARNGDF